MINHRPLKFVFTRSLPLAVLTLLLTVHCSLLTGHAQSATATLSGTVEDEKGAVIPGVTIAVLNVDTSFRREVTTNDSGSFVFTVLPPGNYSLTAERSGFKVMQISSIVLNVTDTKSLQIQLQAGNINETVRIEGGAPLIDESPAVATNIDRPFINNLPLNGRSLQTLINLTPGVVAVPTSTNSQGQFSVNGQRANANYFTVDGVSGNFSVTNFEGLGQNASGSLPSTNIQGGFTNLAPVDSLQEFTIQTSTFAAEFGRQPGGQVSFVTRSGTNEFHGSLFEFVRNDKFDARDFFDAVKPPLRFNNFGGSFGGPVVLPRFGEGGPMFWKGKDKTFFFFTYEGQRFVLPQSAVSTTVPSIAARTTGINGLGPPNAGVAAILRGFPLPNGAEIRDSTGALTGGAIYTTTFSNPTNSDTYSIKIDHNFTKNFSIFGKYVYSPSKSITRDRGNPSAFQTQSQTSEMLTLGATQVFGTKLVNEIRANTSLQKGFAEFGFDGYGGGVLPPLSVFIAGGLGGEDRRFTFNGATNVSAGGYTYGPIVRNKNRQYQLVDNLSYSLGSHQLKFGGDYRLLLPLLGTDSLIVSTAITTLPGLYNNTFGATIVTRVANFTGEFKTFSFYGQDTWKVNKRLMLTYGLRWEINPSETGHGDVKPLTLAAPPDFSKLDQSGLQLAPIGTPYYETDYTNFAPRFGFAFHVSQNAGRELVLSGGIGRYYDLGQSGFGTITFPYSASLVRLAVPFPLPASALVLAPPNFTPSPTNRGRVTVAAADYTLPRIYQWNLKAEQSLGKDQTLSVAYVAALGRKLVRARTLDFATSAATPDVFFSPNFTGVIYIDNGAESSYHSMQAQFTRRLSRGLQGLLSYTWSHSIDNLSDDNSFSAPGFVYEQDVFRGDSDFDVRHNFSGAVSYNIPAQKWGKVGKAILGDWSLNSVFSARTGLPYTVNISESTALSSISIRRPDLTGQPLYLDDPTRATGRRLNPAAFNFNVPGRAMGNLGRNSLRGEGFWQVDMGLHRNFRLAERLKLSFRVEAFNVFNHSNFFIPSTRTASRSSSGVITVSPTFGVITQSAGRSFGGGGNTGGFNPLFQNGGPRSMQFGLRLEF